MNWFALRLYTFMVVVVAMAARDRRRSYRNDETGPRPGTTHCWLLARILELELSRLTSVHWPGGSSRQYSNTDCSEEEEMDIAG